MKRKIIGVISLVLVIVCVWWVYIYRHLDIGEPNPEPADVIIVLEGGNAERATRGTELLNEGLAEADKLIITPYFSTASFDVRDWYYNAGASPEQIVLENNATSTWTNAEYSIELMVENGWDSAIVVTSDYHTRRTRLAFERAADGDYMDFQYVSSYPTVEGEKIHYLDYPDTDSIEVAEVFKYFGYVFGLYYLFDF